MTLVRGLRRLRGSILARVPGVRELEKEVRRLRELEKEVMWLRALLAEDEARIDRLTDQLRALRTRTGL